MRLPLYIIRDFSAAVIWNNLGFRIEAMVLVPKFRLACEGTCTHTWPLPGPLHSKTKLVNSCFRFCSRLWETLWLKFEFVGFFMGAEDFMFIPVFFSFEMVKTEGDRNIQPLWQVLKFRLKLSKYSFKRSSLPCQVLQFFSRHAHPLEAFPVRT